MKRTSATASIAANRAAKAVKMANSGVTLTHTEELFRHQFDSMNAELQRLDAVRQTSDGFQYIDVTKVSETFVSSYGRMISVGYANGWFDYSDDESAS